VDNYDRKAEKHEHSSNSIMFNEYYDKHNNLDESEYDFTKSCDKKYQTRKVEQNDYPEESRKFDKHKDHDVSKAHSLKNEIDTLDNEIKQLQSKLKNMIGGHKK
jgi:hypothetical protein